MNIYIDDELVQLCKARQINMSATFRAVMGVELGIKKGDEIDSLKSMNAKLSAGLEKVINQLAKLTKQLKEKEMKDEGWQTRK